MQVAGVRESEAKEGPVSARPLVPSAIITLDAAANFQPEGRFKAAVALATAAAIDLVTEGRRERVASMMEASYRSVNPSAAPQTALLSPEQAIAELLERILRAAPFSRFWPHQHWIRAQSRSSVDVWEDIYETNAPGWRTRDQQEDNLESCRTTS